MMEIVAFTNFDIDGIHMPIVVRSSETYSILSFLSVAALFVSNLISLQMVMSSHYKEANSQLRKNGGGGPQSTKNDSENR